MAGDSKMTTCSDSFVLTPARGMCDNITNANKRERQVRSAAKNRFGVDPLFTSKLSPDLTSSVHNFNPIFSPCPYLP